MNTDQPNLLKLLCATHFAEGLPNAHLQLLCRAARLLRHAAGEALFREGMQMDDIFVIHSGHVRLSMFVPGRGHVPFLTAGPGDLVGWSGLIGNGIMTATAIAAEDSMTIAMSGQRLQQLCVEEKDLGYTLMKRVAMVISQRLLATRMQLLDLFGTGAMQ